MGRGQLGGVGHPREERLAFPARSPALGEGLWRALLLSFCLSFFSFLRLDLSFLGEAGKEGGVIGDSGADLGSI